MEKSELSLPPWSFSSIECFNQCPRKYYHRYILKEKAPETAAMAAGNLFDKAVEARVKDGTVLPVEWAGAEPFAASIHKAKEGGGKVFTQLKMGLRKDFTPCGFFDADVWGRGVIDVGLVQYPHAIIADWKTGKNNESRDFYTPLQLQVFAAMLFKHFPNVKRVTAFNIYLATGEIGKPNVWQSVDVVKLWTAILPGVMAIEKAFKAQAWPEKPGALCAYCPVKQCAHNRS